MSRRPGWPATGVVADHDRGRHKRNSPADKAGKKGIADSASALDAVIFDMDGVVTDTAEAHAAAWKRMFDEFLSGPARRYGDNADLRPFDVEADYRQFVDGKPRYDGVASFLRSRAIDLPYGDPGDAPESETVCGLGNRKDRMFNAWLDEHRVRTYPTTLRLLDELRAAGIRVGVFTSSRNGDAVMENAGVLDLFEAVVDGDDLAELKIPGKPDPAMLLETASRLGVGPSRTAVVEDAIAGVQAGAAGGFGLVLGVNRGDYGEDLAAKGADIVVRDLGELTFADDIGFVVRTLASLPSVWDCRQEILDRLSGRELALFLDYDGTLTPIVEDFNKAFLSDRMRQAVGALARHCTVGVISGRDLAVLKQLVALNSVLYAGSHGFDIEVPGQLRETLQKGEAFLPDLDRAEGELDAALRHVEGCAIERKRFAIAVHYRRVAEGDIAQVERAVDRVVGGHPRLHKSYGKKVFQIQPRVAWNKGRAIEWLLQRLDLDRENVLPIYVGDDMTDEDAFRHLAREGIAVAVGDEDRPTSARYVVATPDDVQNFLEFLSSAVRGET